MPPQKDDTNLVFHLAERLVNQTGRHIFLTGKAGTGKTTFLKHIISSTKKNCVVVAPTGVAAINAGGVTMHSMFQLPFEPFIPEGKSINHFNTNAVKVADRHSLFTKLRLNKEKRELFEKLELLIIDEVSMMRCDMLDAIDTILRAFRNNHVQPFGGVQVLYIGDLFQLPPVIKNDEWEVLRNYYEGPFFFQSRVAVQHPPLYIELQKIYRQNEQQFIYLLNRVRNNNLDEEDFQLLNSRYNNNFRSQPKEKYIVLCTHNYKADEINNRELTALQTPVKIIKGIIEGDFPDHLLPTEKDLQLKQGAQVMFIKNDSGEIRKYYNGKIGTVKEITDENIIVTDENGHDLSVSRERWDNIKYTYNRERDKIDEEELGSFMQYPFRLAWAITIHKSQGLTFEKAIIDAGQAFAAGQVYVALSRCTSLEGLVLHSRIWPNSVSTDTRIIAYSQQVAGADELSQVLETERQVYQAQQLIKLFYFDDVKKLFAEWIEILPGKKIPDAEAAVALSKTLNNEILKLEETAEKFRTQLQRLLHQAKETGNKNELQQRLQKAVEWFTNEFATKLLEPLQFHIAELSHERKVKQYLKFITGLEYALWQQLQRLAYAQLDDSYLHNEKNKFDKYNPANAKPKPALQKQTKQEKGQTYNETLTQYRSGKTITEIAAARNLAVSTIEGHLAMFVKSGEIDVYELVSKEKVEVILKALNEQTESTGFGTVKEKLGNDYSYADIRAVANYRQRIVEEIKE